MKAVFLDYATMGPDLDLAALEALFSELELYDVTHDDEVADRIRGAACVFTNKFRLGEEILRGAAGLRFIGLTATGTDNIDLASAAKHGIAVANIRGYCTQSVVEHVLGALLMLAHNLHRYNAAVRAGEWQRATSFCMLRYPIRELSGMTLGIVGHGTLGQAVARAAAGLGMRVLLAARPGSSVVAAGHTAFAELLQQSDVISLHCPLNDATRGLFDAAALAAMKPGALLINTARGALVDPAALVAALRSGHLGGAAIDVLAVEPPVAGNPLLDYTEDNLVITPHVAWGTGRARQNAIDELAANAAAFLQGQNRNRVV